jgi:hypothetical protein
VLLRPVKVTLTVTQGLEKATATATVAVTPRAWKTPFELDPAEGRMVDHATDPYSDKLGPEVKPSKQALSGLFTEMENRCAYDPEDPYRGHILHPRRGASDLGYDVAPVADAGGPFDGFYYVTKYRVMVKRKILVNKFIAEDSTEAIFPDGKTFYQENLALAGTVPKPKGDGPGVGLAADIKTFMAKCREHEQMHGKMVKQNFDAGGDPAKDVEPVISRDELKVQEKADEILGKRDKELSEAGADPLKQTYQMWIRLPDSAGSTPVWNLDPVGDPKGESTRWCASCR